MSKFNIGDKVYLECEVSDEDKDNTYELKYRNWRGDEKFTYFVKVDVLHTPDELYNKGLNDAWELAKKIVESPNKGGYKADELAEIFGISDKPVLDAYTPQEALAKVKEYEGRDEIRVGDVVRSKGCNVEEIITKISETKIYRLFKDGSCDSISTKVKEDFEKTGKHFDSIDEFMRQED